MADLTVVLAADRPGLPVGRSLWRLAADPPDGLAAVAVWDRCGDPALAAGLAKYPGLGAALVRDWEPPAGGAVCVLPAGSVWPPETLAPAAGPVRLSPLHPGARAVLYLDALGSNLDDHILADARPAGGVEAALGPPGGDYSGLDPDPARPVLLPYPAAAQRAFFRADPGVRLTSPAADTGVWVNGPRWAVDGPAGFAWLAAPEPPLVLVPGDWPHDPAAPPTVADRADAGRWAEHLAWAAGRGDWAEAGRAVDGGWAADHRRCGRSPARDVAYAAARGAGAWGGRCGPGGLVLLAPPDRRADILKAVAECG